MFTEPAQHSVSLLAPRTYWYEKLQILSAILKTFTVKSTVKRKQSRTALAQWEMIQDFHCSF